MNYRFGNAQHIGARQQQQDSFGFSDSGDESFSAHAGFLAVVADGMGGLAHGDAASRTAVRSFLQNYKAKTDTESIPQALDRSIRAANVDVNTLAASLSQSGEMGTTLVAAAMLDDELFWVSCGDSAIFLLRDGDLTLLNTQHVYARILDERAARSEITNEEALGDRQREALTSHLGQPEMSEVDLSTHAFALQSGDTLLLASDGLFKTISEGEIASVAGNGSNMQAACERLVAAVLEKQRRGQDNVTVVALGYGEVAVVPPPPEAEDPSIEKTQVRDRAKESLAAQQMAARKTVESRLSAAPPPRKIKAWKILVPALIFVAVVAAAGFYSWICCAAPPADPPAREKGAVGYDLDKLPPSKPGSDGKEHPPQEFEPLQPGAVEPARPQSAAPPPASAPPASAPPVTAPPVTAPPAAAPPPSTRVPPGKAGMQ
ncbi:MAG: protein phosphatase 2C domain-containing protein [Acidobacteriota bacterium]